jgi:murein DD-endopeptidase MepM/ murein hydrolase activator NlpD
VRYYGSHLEWIAPGIRPGVPVKAGQLLGRVGTSGDARSVAPHLHFGISWETPKGDLVGPTRMDLPLAVPGRMARRCGSLAQSRDDPGAPTGRGRRSSLRGELLMPTSQRPRGSLSASTRTWRLGRIRRTDRRLPLTARRLAGLKGVPTVLKAPMRLSHIATAVAHMDPPLAVAAEVQLQRGIRAVHFGRRIAVLD